MEYVFLGIFLIASGLHLYARLAKKSLLRDISKVFILLPLTLFYVFAVDTINIFVVIALVACWVGDLLLIKHGIKWFAMGGCSFLLGHAFFVVAYNQEIDYTKIPIWLMIIIPIIYVAGIIVVLIKLKPYIKKALFIPTCCYLMANVTMNVFAVYRLVSGIGNNIILGPLLTAIGALLFLVSDASLFFVRFNKNSRMKTHFLVMLTYTVGELLIVLGLIL